MDATNDTTLATTATAPGRPAAQLVSAQDTNAKEIRCVACESSILRPGKGQLVQHPMALMQSKGAEAPAEQVEWFWRVADMFDFENIGFTKVVDGATNVRYLTCADCERGVLGIQEQTEESQPIYLTTHRVRYV
eukprot:TRINITY_DN92_c3_g1_i1.p1 TRINITY_DN92_c3_g1~~TRINITY_DN92_c3_g1_i1.p1  ORF type:complete len:134 (-),score=16.74 TRINITY_DN92_c3_g1_i1:229-630(-)